MNNQDKTKKELLKELQQLQEKNNALKGFSENDITGRKQAEEARILSESNLQALINDKEVSIWSIDNNYNLIVCNDYFRNAFLAAYQVELKVGINSVNILSPELKAFWKPKYDAALLGEKISFEFKETIQGKLSYFNLFLQPILEDGKVTGVSAHSVNITEIKNAQKIKKENEKLFRVFLENSDAVILLVDPESGRIVFANDSAVKYYGWEKEKLLRMNVNQINTLSPDEIKAKIAESREKKQNYFVFKHRLANGNIRDVEVYQTKLYFEKKELFSVIIHDITERLLAENLLHSFEFKFRTFSDYTADWEYWEDENSEIIYMSPSVEKITGYTFDEFVSDPKLLFSIIHPDDADSVEKHHEKTFSSQCRVELQEIEYRIIKKDGLVITLQHSCRPIFDAENKFLGRRISNRDITERNQAKQELIKAKEKAEESDQLKSAFLANMSHEIRTPMNGILGFADLLKDQELTSDEQQVYIKIIKKSGERLLNIINDLIDISKVEAGQMEVFNSDVNVNEQIEYIYDFFRPEVENKGMQLFFQNGLPAEEAVIRTDSEKLYAILTNLVKNAIKYSDTGTIEIGYNLKNEYLKFFIKDTGIGIPHNKQEAIFDRFVQADISDKKAFQGAGLGLAITKAYVEMLGGNIWVESEEGKGSTFYFTIPFNPELKVNAVPKNVIAAKERKNQIKNLKILIVEDDELSEILLTKIINEDYNDYLYVKNGVDAIEVCRKNPDIDLILMDIKVPEMDGYEVTRQIRQFNKDVIIIAQTAYGLIGDKEKAIAAGCNDYISKPIDKDLLIELIKKYRYRK